MSLFEMGAGERHALCSGIVNLQLTKLVSSLLVCHMNQYCSDNSRSLCDFICFSYDPGMSCDYCIPNRVL